MLGAKAGETNLTVKAMPTSGALKEFKITCPTCYLEHVLVARKIKTLKVEDHLGGKLYRSKLTFVCPKCNTTFTHEHDKWIPEPVELPVLHFMMPSIPKRSATNIAAPKANKK